MKTKIKVLFGAINAVVGVSTVAGIVAFVKDRSDEKKIHKPIYHNICAYERFIKRPLDCFLATGAAIVFSPIILVTALLVRLELGSPVSFTQERPGKEEKIFKLYKFRTMTDQRDPQTDELLPDEVRLTPFGKKLRSTSLDELPELFNIIKGDMAVVGPRPLLTKYLPRYSTEQHRRHEVRPGLTGYAQSFGRNNLSWSEKFDKDVYYVDNLSFLIDWEIILHTFMSVIKHEGISGIGEATMGEFMGEK